LVIVEDFPIFQVVLPNFFCRVAFVGTESLAKFTGCKAVGCYSTDRVTEDVVIFESFLEMEGGVCLAVVGLSLLSNVA
jgi:hypothetical protein